MSFKVLSTKNNESFWTEIYCQRSALVVIYFMSRYVDIMAKNGGIKNMDASTTFNLRRISTPVI